MNKEKSDHGFQSRSDFLETYVDEMVGVINLKDNAFDIATNLSLKEELFNKINQANQITEIKVIVIISSESALGKEKHAKFVSKIVENFDGEKYLFREEHALSQFVQMICRVQKMVISCVRGSVVGAFLGAILATDHRIVSESTVFSFPHIQCQMPPQGALAFFLPRYIGRIKAKKILLHGESINAVQAHELELVDGVIGDDGFEQGCIEIAKKMSQVPQNVVIMTKSLMNCDLKGLSTYFEMEAKLATKYRIKMPLKENNE